MGLKQPTCKSGIKGWRMKLRKVYEGGFEQFQAYCESHGIHTRLGYKTPESAWKKNPMIEGSVIPSDLRVVKTRRCKKR